MDLQDCGVKIEELPLGDVTAERIKRARTTLSKSVPLGRCKARPSPMQSPAFADAKPGFRPCKARPSPMQSPAKRAGIATPSANAGPP
jgi:hypothetical protein